MQISERLMPLTLTLNVEHLLLTPLIKLRLLTLLLLKYFIKQTETYTCIKLLFYIVN